MKFKALKLPGVYLIELDKNEDERGFFARTFCEREFLKAGIHTHFVQCNVSYNSRKGTLRGMHFQKAPHEEVKVVSCMRGRIYDVVLDIREGSETYGEWISEILSGENNHMLYIPAGMAHGFQTLDDDTLVYYQMGDFFVPNLGAGIRYDDPRFNIKWPVDKIIISEKDSSW